MRDCDCLKSNNSSKVGQMTSCEVTAGVVKKSQ